MISVQRKIWVPYAASCAGEVGRTIECRISPRAIFRGEEFFAFDTAARPGLGTVIEGVQINNEVQRFSPTPTWVFGEWLSPGERAVATDAAKLVGTPLETAAIRKEVARLGMASASGKMAWKTCLTCADIVFKVRFLETCAWYAVLWGWTIS